MTNCPHCQGIGYTSVRNGDDDIVCKVCEGTGKVREPAKRQKATFFWSNYTKGELAMLEMGDGNEVQPFDLSEF